MSNCSLCFTERYEVFCEECEDNRLFRLSDDKKSCIRRDCSEINQGCTKCDDDMKCIECDTNQHYKLDNTTHVCNCAENYTQIEGRGKCVPYTNCDSSITNCKQCTTPTQCMQCEYGYGLSDGKCTQCPAGQYYSGTTACMPECNYENCKECTLDEDNNMNHVCNNCISDEYIPAEDGKNCIKFELYNCTHIIGCAKCIKGYDSFCYECDEDNHFTYSQAHNGQCYCQTGYDLVDNKCIEAITPELMPTVPEDAFQTTLTIANGVASVEKFDDTKPSYSCKVESTANQLVLPSSDNKDVYVEIAKRDNKPLELNVSSTTPLVVTSTDPQTTLALPKENDITIEAQNKLTVNPIDTKQTDAVNIQNLRPTGELSLDSDNNISINELDIYGTKTVIGQVGENKQTTCSNARLARGSSFTPISMIIENIEVGLISKVLMKQARENVKVGNFIIDYNRTQDPNVPIPISFSDYLPDLANTGIVMKLVEGNATLQAEEVFKLAEFNSFESNTKDDDIKEQCNNLAKNYNTDTETGFTSKPECLPNEKGGYDLIAKKKVSDDDGGKKKNKLSGGAIAGIVIACVVVVAAIIALLVYFLVIKKKNQSTTSTQGDSSIAI
ncbi:hypothetical protein M9Y10_001465 [Tritrichomonas musculus]|uniref:EGF-like domain-containing protein n=1 Tax=Tritrichomonas musculus TaxID=1915356 RepID=A0ABR2L7Y5_9EUKA